MKSQIILKLIFLQLSTLSMVSTAAPFYTRWYLEHQAAQLPIEVQQDGWLLNELESKINTYVNTNTYNYLPFEALDCWDLQIKKNKDAIHSCDKLISLYNQATQPELKKKYATRLLTFIRLYKLPESHFWRKLKRKALTEEGLTPYFSASYIVPRALGLAAICLGASYGWYSYCQQQKAMQQANDWKDLEKRLLGSQRSTVSKGDENRNSQDNQATTPDQITSIRNRLNNSNDPVGTLKILANFYPELTKIQLLDLMIYAQSNCSNFDAQLSFKQINVDAYALVLSVKNQFDSDGGGTASCAYHTVKNFMLIRNWIADKFVDVQDKLNDPKVIKDHFDQWRSVAVPTSKTCSWTDKVEEIHTCAQKNGLADKHLDYPFTVIDAPNTVESNNNIDWNPVHPEDPIIAWSPIEEGDVILKGLQSNKEYVHGFAFQSTPQLELSNNDINNDIENLDRLNKFNGHWKLLTLHKDSNGKRIYYICDSTNSTNVDNSTVQKIISAIEKLAAKQN